MADIIVTFSDASRDDDLPVDSGVGRTESVAIGGAAAQTTLTAGSKDNIVNILAGANCWVSIGDPNNNALKNAVASSTAGSNRRAMSSGQEKQFHVKQGHAVAVITRA